jgi:hypothetical protein
MRDCGGCQGLGSHWRWCPEKVGGLAYILGTNADKAESIGDTVGSNYPQGANYAYGLASMLRKRAEEVRIDKEM